MVVVPLQTLSLHTTQPIVDHVISNARLELDGFDMSPAHGRLLLPLFGACHNSLLLALACPNLSYAAVPPKCRKLFMAHMDELIHTVVFRPYAVRLRRLLFGGWKNKFPGVRAAQQNTTHMANIRLF
ncbi:hypothetical protein GGI20_003845 [Coemansia sp. BCRC 34301]|nr:hypothetical protein GGI20_003845 [Coemansia sp. BCRC 34301]